MGTDTFMKKLSLEELFLGVYHRTTRNERIYQAVRIHHYTLREVGDCVGLLYSTISVIAKRVHETMKS
ncbi:hypothetical protein KAU37_12695, partial [Candidatus Bipolaricaulota bacterium]|nr:hypothetical protein [Candidatus Bipolaricaulota bacterium]